MDYPQGQLDDLERILRGQNEPNSLGYQLLQQLTGDFSVDRRIGEGGCGEVYKGILPNGVVIAVKKFRKDFQNVTDESMFVREIDSLIKTDHRNIVRFLGYCFEKKYKKVEMNGTTVWAEDPEKLLCYEYISKGSLDNYLTDELRGFGWDTRYKIIKGICDGLFYLHHHKGKSILHMDLKPGNILLGDQMVPKITDFGLSRDDAKTQITSSPLKYSPGYCAPEYIDDGKRSCKSDIYSLGVIMLELVTGSRKMPNTTKVLRRWRHRWNKSSKQTPLRYLQVQKCLELAVSCQRKNPLDRPFISYIVSELNKLDSWDGQIRESSLDKIIFSSDDMLGIEPLELHFPLSHDKQISCPIELTNDTDHYMAFRIATTSLLSFSIQTDKEIAAPRSRCQITITLPAQEMAQLQNHTNEEFIVVQSTRIDNGSLTAADITVEMFDEEWGYSQKKIDGEDKVVDEVNVAVLFDMLHEDHQKDVTNLSAEMGSLGTSSQEVQESTEMSPHHDYVPSRHMEVLERLLDGSQSPTHLPLSLLRYITADFSDERKIGSGGFAEVFKGIVGNKTVAVKKLSCSHIIDDRLFHREVRAMMAVEHKNIVRFLGYCSHTEQEAQQVEGRFIMVEIRERLLCLEYITDSLEKYITDGLRGLEWHTRYQILMGICKGLLHLHMEKNIIHMDIKPTNIRLDDCMVPKIADFCISRLVEASQIFTTEGIASRGYSSPEYLTEGRMSAMYDIYSLGVVITELVTGSKKSPNINSVLRKWRHRWNKSANYTPLWHQQVTKCLKLAVRCTDKNPLHRPNICDILSGLNASDSINSSVDDMCLDEMLGVEPLELHFSDLNTQQSRSIYLINDTNHHIAFMVRLKWELAIAYSIQPDKGVVPPRSMHSVNITLQAQGEPWWCDDFIVKSTRVAADVTAADVDARVMEDMFDDEVMVEVIYHNVMR